jgi:ABC-type Fe3+-hydroxamate transport system, periplasmic component
MKNIIKLSLSIVILAIYTGCGTNNNKADKEEKGLRIVSLIPSATETIYELNASNMLVGCTSYCETDPQDSIEIVSSVIKANVEKIITLKPDIVFASDMTPIQDLDKLRKFNISIEVLHSPGTFNEICEQYLYIAKKIGKEKEANDYIKDYKAIADSIFTKNSNKSPRPKIFMQIGSDPIFGVLPDKFMNDYIKYCGGENIIKENNVGIINREYVAASNPDYIFVVIMGITGTKEIEQWKELSSMNAVVKNNLYIISDIACQPIPISFITALKTMDKYISK